MPLTPGTRLGPYEILAPLGAGGMGEVYRAKDTRLGRDVAVKVLPQHLSDQPDVRARFEREARTISSLNHPHICMLFDVGREGDVDYLVMELIEGETLSDRLKRGPLAPTDMLRLGTQVADALDRAHRAGVIHRDLKPGNVMLTRSGAKLMDFGLSRATVGGMPGSSSQHSVLTLTYSPATPQVTAEGTLLGTFQYMAPELLEGKDADARSDIWALGCVLYEMATARHAFEGRSQASLIAAILERDPPAIGEVPSGSGILAGTAPPHGMERLIRNCLVKDPEERIQTAHDVKLRLQEIAESAGVGAASAAAPSASTVAAAGDVHGAAGARRAAAPLPWLVAATGVAAAIAVFAWLAPKAFAPPPPAVRFRVAAPPGLSNISWPRVSPDGRFLLFQCRDTSGTPRAYVRALDQVAAHAVSGTERVIRAYWSPDGKEIAFVADGKIQRVAVAGGTPVVICAAPGGADVSWGRKGHVLLDGAFTDSIRAVPAGGGELLPVTRIDRAAGEIGTSWPSFLPDGEHFLFIGTRSDAQGEENLRLGRLGSLDSKLLGRCEGRAEYVDGWIVFPRSGSLFAQRLDVGAGKLVGPPITVVDQLRMDTAQGHFSVSPSGVFAFILEEGSGSFVIRESDRAGNLGRTFAQGLGIFTNPRFSPEGKRLLYQRTDRGLTAGGDVHVVDLERSTDTRLTFTNGDAFTPQWSPDGRRFAYITRSRGGMLRTGAADGLGGQDSIPLRGKSGPALSQWTKDGRLLGFSNAFEAFEAPLEGPDRAARPFLDPDVSMVYPALSPDGKWVSFASGRQPNIHVYVQSLAGPAGRWQISTSPAAYSQWSRNGSEIVYQQFDGRLMAVDIDTRSGFVVGTPHPMAPPVLPMSGPGAAGWTVDASGERFMLVQRARPGAEGSVEVVTRFKDLVTRR